MELRRFSLSCSEREKSDATCELVTMLTRVPSKKSAWSYEWDHTIHSLTSVWLHRQITLLQPIQLDTTPWPPVKPPPSHLASRRPTTRARADRALNTPCRPLQHPASARPKTASRFRHPKRPRRARPPRPRRPRAAPRASFDPRLRASLCLQMARASASSTGTWPD